MHNNYVRRCTISSSHSLWNPQRLHWWSLVCARKYMRPDTHTHKHKYMHKVGTIAVFWTSSPTKFTRDNLRYSILKTVSSKVRWIASQVPLRQSQIKFNWGVSQVSPLKTIKSKPRKAISRKGYWISAEVNSLHIMSSKFHLNWISSKAKSMEKNVKWSPWNWSSD